ncbi:P-loop containing nucleoside triphosphate hydrolase protein [Ceratobasidium sp. AG-I]|nr:P-loop containing nucleoside triphosphate hydrolase protein [Ceratobasidium sp. AG-I]
MVLRKLGFPAVPLHGQLSQSARSGALNKFKADIPAVDVVINFDIPTHSKDYIHRVGRTARAGRAGKSITLVTQYDVELLRRIEEVIGKKMMDFEVARAEVVLLKERVGEAQRLAIQELKDVGGAAGMRSGRKTHRDREEGGNDRIDRVDDAVEAGMPCEIRFSLAAESKSQLCSDIHHAGNTNFGFVTPQHRLYGVSSSWRIPRHIPPSHHKVYFLACSDVHSGSRVEIRVYEKHLFSLKRVGTLEYDVSKVADQLEASFDFDSKKFKVVLSFPPSDVISSQAKQAASTALAEAQAKEKQTRLLERLGPTRDALKAILDFGQAVSELHPAAKIAFGICKIAWDTLEKQEQCDASVEKLVVGRKAIPAAENGRYYDEPN